MPFWFQCFVPFLIQTRYRIHLRMKRMCVCVSQIGCDSTWLMELLLSFAIKLKKMAENWDEKSGCVLRCIVFMCLAGVYLEQSLAIYIYFHATLDARYVIYVLTIKLGHNIHLIYLWQARLLHSFIRLLVRSLVYSSHRFAAAKLECSACLNPADGSRYSR